jgi:hypothetical protein
MAVQRYGENAFSEVVDIRAIPEWPTCKVGGLGIDLELGPDT